MSRSKPDFGPSVSNGILRYTSASAVQTFDAAGTYGGCNRKFYFTRVLGMKEPDTVSKRIGTEGHEQLENWARTGIDSLGPFARVGKHLLPAYDPKRPLFVETPLASEEGTKAAIKLREERANVSVPGWDVAFEREIAEKAGLSLAGVPVVGYIDLHHRRGEYVDPEGAVRPEAAPESTIENLDHKFTSIDIREKTVAHVDSVQMTVYDAWVANKYPDVRFIRNSHVYYQTRGAKTARKVTFLTTVDEVRKKEERVASIVRAMKDVAGAKRVEDVEPYGPSCDAYRGCHFKSVCPYVPNSSIHDLFARSSGDRANQKGDQMSGRGLFDTVPESTANGSANGTGLFASLQEVTIDAPPDLPSVAYDDEVRRLAAEDGVPYVAYGTCGCGASLNSLNASRLRDGTVKHIGCPRSVNPPEKPAADIVAQAAPLSPEAIAEITDPTLRAKVEAHREEHLQRQAATAQAQGSSGEKKSGRCPAGGERITFTPQEIQAMAAQGRAKKIPCRRCGKVIGIKLSEDKTATTIPGHLSKAEPAAEAPPEIPGEAPPDLPPELETPPALPEEYRAPGALPGQTAMPFTKDSFDVALARTMVKDAMKKLAQVLEALG